MMKAVEKVESLLLKKGFPLEADQNIQYLFFRLFYTKKKPKSLASNGSEISDKEKLTKNAVSGQPKGLKSIHNNRTEDSRCVKCVFSTVLHFKPLTEGHTARRTKREISLKVRLLSTVSVWKRNKSFSKLLNAAKGKA